MTVPTAKCLTPDFLENVMRKYENNDSIKILEFNSKPACEKGDNFMSVVSKVFVKGEKIINNAKIEFSTSLIIKSPITSAMVQDTFQTNDIFANEVIAYNKIIPELSKYYKIKLPVANCLFASKECIILEDLSLLDYQMKTENCMSIEDCVAILKELAILHASSVVLKHNAPDQIHSFSNQIMEYLIQENGFFFKEIDNSIQSALIILKKESEKYARLIDYLECHKHEINPSIFNLFNSKYDTAVVNHGDCWRNNILFKSNDGTLNVKLVDLQIMRYTSIAADLSYFLFINLAPKIRRQHFDYLLNEYFDTLKHCISAHDIQIDSLPYSLERLKKEMDDFQIFGSVMSLLIAPIFYMDKELLPDMENLQAELLDPEKQREYFLNHVNPRLKDRIVDIVSDFVDHYKFQSTI